MRKRAVCFAYVLVALSVLGFAAAIAHADTVNMAFTGVGGANADGYYVFPYLFTVTDQTTKTTTTNVPLMCISFDREIYQTNPPETWQATLETAGEAGTQYEEAAYFLSTAVGGSAQAVIDAQLAAWYLFDPTNLTLKNDMTVGAWALVDQTYQNSFLIEYANNPVYLAIDTTQSTGGIPQNFIGLTPEPGTWALFGSGLMGIVAILYLKRRPVARADQLRF